MAVDKICKMTPPRYGIEVEKFLFNILRSFGVMERKPQGLDSLLLPFPGLERVKLKVMEDDNNVIAVTIMSVFLDRKIYFSMSDCLW